MASVDFFFFFFFKKTPEHVTDKLQLGCHFSHTLKLDYLHLLVIDNYLHLI